MRGRAAILILLGILIVLGTVIGIIVIQLFYRQPFVPPSTLAAMLSLTPVEGTPGTSTPMRILTATPSESELQIPPATPLPSPELLNTPGPTETPGPLKEVCGKTGSYILLGILTDVTNPDLDNDGAIGFRVIQVDFSRERIIVYAIPPELVLPGANLQPYGRTSATLTDAFDIIYHAERSNADAVSLAANGIAQMINENLGILASHYMVVDTAAVEDFVVDTGSMDVKVSATYVSADFDFPRGTQKMDGALIRRYIVAKSSQRDSEWDRVLRQNDVINAFRNFAKDQDTTRLASNFINQREDGFISSLTFGQVRQLMCLANTIDSVRFRYFSMPVSRLELREDGTIIMADQQSLQANIANSLGGTGE